MKKKAEEWARLSGIEIIDPDGWDRRAEYFDADWNKEITLDEFCQKATRSTTRDLRRIVFKNL